MKNMNIIWTEIYNIMKYWHFVENKTEIMVRLKNAVNFFVG